MPYMNQMNTCLLEAIKDLKISPKESEKNQKLLKNSLSLPLLLKLHPLVSNIIDFDKQNYSRHFLFQ